jgi:hypothetical protein
MHNHGHQYRALIIAEGGPTEYSEWFNTLDELQRAIGAIVRDPNKQYKYERKAVRCLSDCDVEEHLVVAGSL